MSRSDINYGTSSVEFGRLFYFMQVTIETKPSTIAALRELYREFQYPTGPWYPTVPALLLWAEQQGLISGTEREAQMIARAMKFYPDQW